MKLLLSMLVFVLVSGCAVVDAEPRVSVVDDNFKSFEPIIDGVGQDLVEHGVVTIENVLTHSDVVVIPETDQHVIWVAPSPVIVSMSPKPEPSQIEASTAHRIDNSLHPESKNANGVTWPLLEVDGDMTTEIGRVSMCGDIDQARACDHTYDCKFAKAGAYCVEKYR